MADITGGYLALVFSAYKYISRQSVRRRGLTSILFCTHKYKAKCAEQRTERHTNQVVVDRGPLAEGTICAKLII